MFGVLVRRFSSSSSRAQVVRHGIEWRKKSFYEEEGLEEELRRVLDVCHGCRRCFNLCDSFPSLFKAVDAAPSEELDSVPSSAFKPVVDACTLCDMCYTAKCPYVPPHDFAIDLPHLFLRYRAWEHSHVNLVEAEAQPGGVLPGPVSLHHKPVPPASVLPGVSRKLVKGPSSTLHQLYAQQDLVAPVATRLAPLVNAATQKKRTLARRALESLAGLDQNAPLPPFVSQTFAKGFVPDPPKATDEPSAKLNRKVVIYVGCFVNHNRPSVGEAVVKLLRASNVHVEMCYPECCGMPQLEQGLVGNVASKGVRVAEQLSVFLDRGFDVVSLTPSCTLMLKQEWPLLHAENAMIKRLAESTWEASEYLFQLSKDGLLCGGQPPPPLSAKVTLHHACHARAQNMGWKSKELLALIPKLKVGAVERCSGHGGIWGFEKENYETGHKVGAAVVSRAIKDAESEPRELQHFITSDCPMAADHLLDGMERQQPDVSTQRLHPLEILAMAYDLVPHQMRQ